MPRSFNPNEHTEQQPQSKQSTKHKKETDLQPDEPIPSKKARKSTETEEKAREIDRQDLLKKEMQIKLEKEEAEELSRQLFPAEKFPPSKVPKYWYALNLNNILPEVQIKKRTYRGELGLVRAPLMFNGFADNDLFSSSETLQKYMDMVREFAVFQKPEECDFMVDVLGILEKAIDKQKFSTTYNTDPCLWLFKTILIKWRENIKKITPKNFFQECVEKNLNDFLEEIGASPDTKDAIRKKIEEEISVATERLSEPHKYEKPKTTLKEEDRISKLLNTPYFSKHKTEPSFLERMIEILPEKKLDIDFYRDVHRLWSNLFRSVFPDQEQTEKSFKITHFDEHKVSKKEAKKASYWLMLILEGPGNDWSANSLHGEFKEEKLPKDPKLAFTIILLFSILSNQREEIPSLFFHNLPEETKKAIKIYNEEGQLIPPLVWINLILNDEDLVGGFIREFYDNGLGICERYEHNNKNYNPLSLLQKIQKSYKKTTRGKGRDSIAIKRFIGPKIMPSFSRENEKTKNETLGKLGEFLYRQQEGPREIRHKEKALKDIFCKLSDKSYPSPLNSEERRKQKLEKIRHLELIQKYLTKDHPIRKEPPIKIPTKFDHIEERQIIPTVSLKNTESIDIKPTDNVHLRFPDLLTTIFWRLQDCFEIGSTPSKLNGMVGLLDDMCSFNDRRELKFFCWLNELMNQEMRPYNTQIMGSFDLIQNILNAWSFEKINAIENPRKFINKCVEKELDRFFEKNPAAATKDKLKAELIEKIMRKLQELTQKPKSQDTKEEAKEKASRLEKSLYFADYAGGPSFVDRMKAIAYDENLPQPTHPDRTLHEKCACIFGILINKNELKTDLFCVTSINGVKLSEEDIKKTNKWFELILYDVEGYVDKKRQDIPDLPDNPEAIGAILRMSFMHNYSGQPTKDILEKIKDRNIIKNMKIKCAEDNSDIPTFVGMAPFTSCGSIEAFIEAMPPEELFLREYEYQDPNTGTTSKYDILSLWEKLTESQKEKKDVFFSHMSQEISELLFKLKTEYCKDMAIREAGKLLELEKKIEKDTHSKSTDVEKINKEMKEIKLSGHEEPSSSGYTKHKIDEHLFAEKQRTTLTEVTIHTMRTETQKDHGNRDEPMKH